MRTSRAIGGLILWACLAPVTSNAAEWIGSRITLAHPGGSALLSPEGVAFAALDGGARQDLFIMTTGGNFRLEHGAAVAERGILLGPGYDEGIAFPDLTGDGLPEIVVWDNVAQRVAVYERSVAGVATLAVEVTFGTPRPWFAQLDGRPGLELVYHPDGLSTSGTGPPVVRHAAGMGIFVERLYQPLGAWVGDYDGDGRVQGLFDDASQTHWVSRAIGDDLRPMAEGSLVRASALSGYVRVGDVDGDRHDDLVVWQSDGQVEVRRGQTQLTLGPTEALLNAGALPTRIYSNGLSLHDVDGDGAQEIVIDDGLVVRAFAVTGTEAELRFEAPWPFPHAVRRAIASGDHDGDGATDLALVWRESILSTSTEIAIWRRTPTQGGGGAFDAALAMLLALLRACCAGASVRRRQAVAPARTVD